MCAALATLPLSRQLFAAAGIVPEHDEPPAHLSLFTEQADRVLHEVYELVASDEMTADSAARFAQLIVDAAARVMCHPIVASNRYLARFAEGVTFAQARHEVQSCGGGRDAG